MRTRIKRGLDRLRADLDRRAGSRNAWLGAFAAWLEVPPPSIGQAGAPLARRGVPARRALRFAAAGAASVGAFWLAWLALGTRAEGTRFAAADPARPVELASSEASTDRVPLEPDSVVGALPAASARSEVGTSAVPERDATATNAGSAALGRVRREDGTAASGASVFVWSGDRGRLRDGRVDGALAVRATDADGSFALAGLPDAFVVFADDGERVASACLVARAARSKTYAGLELSLVAPATLTGTVRDPGGRSQAFATVALHAAAERVGDHPTGRRDASYANALVFTTTCDAAGRFDFERVVPGRYEVVVDEQSLENRLELRAGARDVELVAPTIERVEPGAREVHVTAHVVDAAGAPVHDFDVAALAGEPVPFRVVRGEDGGFELIARSAPDARLWVGAADHAHRLLRVDAIRDVDTRIVLARETEATLRLVSSRGEPLTGARVTLHDAGGEPRMVPAGGKWWSNVLRADSEGRCRALALPAEELCVVVERDDGAIERFRVDLGVASPGERVLTLAERSLVIRGLGALAEGAPSSDARIEFAVLDARGAALTTGTGTWHDGAFAEEGRLRARELELDEQGVPCRVRDTDTARSFDAREARLPLAAGASAVELRTGSRVERLVLPAEGAIVWDVAAHADDGR